MVNVLTSIECYTLVIWYVPKKETNYSSVNDDIKVIPRFHLNLHALVDYCINKYSYNCTVIIAETNQ
jgi:hypothetical protein